MAKKRALKVTKKKKQSTTSPGEELAYFKERAKAMEIEKNGKPKSHKVKKLLERKEKILQNDPKHSVFMKGNKCSQVVMDTMRELHKMRNLDISKCLLQKKNEMQPYEDASGIEKVAYKHDAGFVCFGNHNKKRPNNMILTRMYNIKVLDMLEFGINECKTMQDYGNIEQIEVGQQPILLFQGDAFDLSDKHIKFKNMMIDFFRIKHLDNINILEVHRIITFTCKSTEEDIVMQQFESGKINEGLAGQGNIDLKEIGPKISMEFRRCKMPDNDTWKAATKVQKSKAKQMDKKHNITKNALGQRIGKAFIQQQDLGTLALKKPKRSKLVEGEEEGMEKPTENESGGEE